MEALLTSNVNLDSDDLMWINSHLPDNDGMGQYKKQYKFKHDQDDLFKCLGITESTARKVADVFAEATKNLMTKDNYNLSNGVEEILNNASEIESFEALIVSKLLKDSVDRISEMSSSSALMDLLKMMRKRKGDD